MSNSSQKLLEHKYYQVEAKKVCPLCKKQRLYFCELGCNTCRANIAKLEKIIKLRK